MEGLRRTYGIAEPVKRGMELQICRAGEWRPAALGKSAAVSSDVLSGRDCEIGWEDVFKGMCIPGKARTAIEANVWTGDEMREAQDFHTEMEQGLKMNS